MGIQIGNKFRAVVKKVLSKAQRTHSETLLAKVARRQANGGWRFVEAPPILTGLDNATRQKVISSLTEYGETLPPEYRNMLHRYSVADVCHRVVGVGSVGMRAYLVLLFGNGDADPLFLQVKEAVAPAHAPYLPPPPMRIQHEGRRVVGAQRLRPLKVATVLRFSESDTSEKGIDAPIGSVVGGTLGLLAFLLASTFGMAASRFDTRRQLLLDEVNAIGTCYLRADLVTQPERVEIRKRLREYVHLRAEAVKQPQTLRILAPEQGAAGRYEQFIVLTDVAQNAPLQIDRRQKDGMIVVTAPKAAQAHEPPKSPSLDDPLLEPLSDWDRSVGPDSSSQSLAFGCRRQSAGTCRQDKNSSHRRCRFCGTLGKLSSSGSL